MLSFVYVAGQADMKLILSHHLTSWEDDRKFNMTNITPQCTCLHTPSNRVVQQDYDSRTIDEFPHKKNLPQLLHHK